MRGPFTQLKRSVKKRARFHITLLQLSSPTLLYNTSPQHSSPTLLSNSSLQQGLIAAVVWGGGGADTALEEMLVALRTAVYQFWRQIEFYYSSAF